MTPSNRWNVDVPRTKRYKIDIGMAKETAHQLGTPISSLMGWVGLLEENPSNKEKIF